MSMQLMTPPSDGNAHSITVNGRTYSAAAATWISVPGFDAVALQANGWSSSPPLAAATASLLGGVVATSGAAGQFVEAVDTTTGALVFGTPAGGGNIVSSGTPVANQLAIFTSPTAIEGVSTLPAANLPLPTATTIGAVQANAGTAGQFVSGVNTSTGALIYATPAGGGNLSTTGTPTANQIAAFTNATTLEGLSTLPAALLPAPTATTLGGVAAYTSPTNQYVNAITTAGAVTSVGIGFANLTGDLALSQIPTGGSSTTYLRGDGSWQTPSGGGNLSNSGTPAANQLAVFTNATTLEGLSTLPAALLPAPTATTLGGVQSFTAPANQFVTGVNASGAHQSAQPSFANLSGVATGAQLPAPTVATLGGVQSYTAPTNQFLTGVNTSGIHTSAQPSFSNLSGNLALAQVPAGGSSTTYLRGDGTYAAPLPIASGALGSSFSLNTIEGGIETITPGGLTYSSILQIPALSMVVGVSTIVKTAITGCTAFELGTSAMPNLFATGLSTAIGSANAGIGGPYFFSAATSVLLTSTAGGNFTGGTIRLSVQYLSVAAPTS